MLQRVAGCCGVSHRCLVCCSVLQCVAVCCSVLHRVAVSYRVSMLCSVLQYIIGCVAESAGLTAYVSLVYSSVQQCVAMRCSVLQSGAVYCSVSWPHSLCRWDLLLFVSLPLHPWCVAVCCSMLHYVAVCCSMLQCAHHGLRHVHRVRLHSLLYCVALLTIFIFIFIFIFIV